MPAAGGNQSPVKPTFQYKVATSLAELTNSIRVISAQLRAQEAASGSNNTNVANLLNDLAEQYHDLGDYAGAEPLYLRCLTIREQLLGSDAAAVGDVLNDLAYLYKDMEDYDRALPVFERSLHITENALGAEHSDVAVTLNNLAELKCKQGAFIEALGLCNKALSIRTNLPSPNYADVVDSLANLAEIYNGLGSFREALASCQRGMAIAEKTLPPADPLVANLLFMLGRTHANLGNSAESLSAYRRTLAIDEKISGPDHPDVIEVLSELAALFAKRRDWVQSLSTSADLCNREHRYLIGQTLALPDAAALRSTERLFQSTEFIHSICIEAASGESHAPWPIGARTVALNKAFLEEVRAAQAALEVDPRTTTRALREQYRALQFQLDRLAKSEVEEAYRGANRGDLQGELSRVEQQLLERVGALEQALRDRSLALQDIARNLTPAAALVDFVQYRRYDFTAKGTNQWKEQRYAVYLTFSLSRDSTNVIVQCVDLGEASPIDETVGLICKRMSAGQYEAKDLAPALQRLGELVYAPLARYLTNVSSLIVCPDGQLSRLPFEMLRVGDRFLLEEKMISYVTSGREVARLARNPKSEVRSQKSLVMGAPDFDLDLAKAGSSRRKEAQEAIRNPTSEGRNTQSLVTSATRTLSRDYRGIKFQPLSGAADEARSVAALLGGDCALRLGAEARESELKAVQSPRVLHLATHGFYLSDQEFHRTNAPGDGWIASMGTRWNASLPKDDWENPLVRCGIALAGANHAGQITNALAEDGILTGLEASLLNLQGTELVILSACDSGTGEVKIGEGVMSLRRAFRIAGAQTVLASHWKVSDKATSQLMTEFMRRWRAGEPRAQAWREAQLSLLHSKEFASPYFWAAFTLTGQWR
jgi:CHAT domain-containing protein/tetratricopeptide (TPR) repeat protein